MVSNTVTQHPTAPFHLHRVRVAAITDLSPSFRRFTLHGPNLDRFADNGYDQRFKLILPLDEHGVEPMPIADDWYAQWRELPPEMQNPIRTYTVRAVRPHDREIDVDVVMHPVIGPASRWATETALGSELLVLGPNSDYDGVHGGVDFLPPAHTERLLIAGDETALPAIVAMLEGLPEDARGIAVIELPLSADAVCVPSHPGIDVRVVARDGAVHGSLLTPAVESATAELLDGSQKGGAQQSDEPEDVDIDAGLLWEVPVNEDGGPALESTPLYAWLAGEAGVIKGLRRHLVRERGIDRSAVAFMGYWRIGKSEGA